VTGLHVRRESIPGCANLLQVEPKLGFKMLRDEDYGHSIRWQSVQLSEDGTTAEVFWERDENYDEGQIEYYRELCYQGRHRLYEDGSRADFTEVHPEVGFDFKKNEPIDRAVSQVWHIVSTNATKTVPAGTFENVLVLAKTFTATPSYTKEYWFAQGVGKVYESSPPEEVEELTSWYIP
jgi:hypothetical protein